MRSRVKGIKGCGQKLHQSVFRTWLVLTSNMNLQVLPLRVLVSRQVIRDRMDYTDYLAGETKSEMDILDRLAGRFVVQASELTVERGGKKMPADEWERWRSKLPGTWINFLDGTEEIRIGEESSKSGAKKWVISDMDGVKKGFLLTSSGRMLMLRDNYWIHSDNYVEDGNLITAQKTFMMKRSKLALDHWATGPLDQSLLMDYRDSFSTDKQGNLVREFICSMPIADIKITKVMWALRISESEKPLQRGSSAVRKVFEKIRKVLQEGKHLFQNMLSEFRGN